MTEIKNKTFDKERSLYGLYDTVVDSCRFEGIEDGESPLKECGSTDIVNCYLDLRYPIWHLNKGSIINTEFTTNSRAPFWYSNNVLIKDSFINGIKFLRECHFIDIHNSKFYSPEFAWLSSDIKMKDCIVDSVYAFLKTDNVIIDNLKFTGKYSFQYMNNLTITNSSLDTKDAFWHSKNVVVKSSIVKGEYLGWYADNLTFIDCKIIGTQPLCYSTNIKLINCEMIDCDFSFENSDVDCDVTTDILSIKNPKSGTIKCRSYRDLIVDEYKRKGDVVIITPNKKIELS